MTRRNWTDPGETAAEAYNAMLSLYEALSDDEFIDFVVEAIGGDTDLADRLVETIQEN